MRRYWDKITAQCLRLIYFRRHGAKSGLFSLLGTMKLIGWLIILWPCAYADGLDSYIKSSHPSLSHLYRINCGILELWGKKQHSWDTMLFHTALEIHYRSQIKMLLQKYYILILVDKERVWLQDYKIVAKLFFLCNYSKSRSSVVATQQYTWYQYLKTHPVV